MSSDHFNGQRYFNPWGSRPRESFFDILRLMWAMATAPGWKYSPRALPAALPSSVAENEVSLTFVNHVTFLIQTQKLNLLTDPAWSKRASPLQFMGPRRYRDPGLAFDQLPRIDVVLISHNHYDHMDSTTIRRLQKKFAPLFIVAKGDGVHVKRFGAVKVVELDWWDEASLGPGAKVVYTPARHFSGRTPFDRDRTLWGGFMIEIANQKIFFSGDTAYSQHFSLIREKLGSPDTALLGIGAYEPYWFMKHVHMNPADAVQAHLDLAPKRSIGMHFGTFRLTAEPIDEPEKALARALAERGIALDRFLTPVEGQTFRFRP